MADVVKKMIVQKLGPTKKLIEEIDRKASLLTASLEAEEEKKLKEKMK